MKVAHIPGLTFAIVDRGKPVRTAAFGWADMAQRRLMSSGTLINIASITKVVTATAVMQLWERGKFQLDDDVDAYLPFKVSNPAHAQRPITFHQLLTHSSSIADEPAYDLSYMCGDAPTPLDTWLRNYLVPGGANYDSRGNFYSWAPGESWGYSNIAYGLLGYLIELLSGLPYDEYCIGNILAPLGMSHSRFKLAGMERGRHATAYSYSTDGDLSKVVLPDPSWSAPADSRGGFWVPHCLYGFVTAADGLLRTSVDEFVRFILAFIHAGELDGKRVLQPATVARMLTDQHIAALRKRPGVEVTVQGLGWRAWPDKYGAQTVWGHRGSDPGVSTLAAFRPSDQRGVVVFGHAGSGPDVAAEIATRVFSH